MMNPRYPCYTTKSGLKIGLFYEPPQVSYMTKEAELIQRALLYKAEPWYQRLSYLALMAAMGAFVIVMVAMVA